MGILDKIKNLFFSEVTVYDPEIKDTSFKREDKEEKIKPELPKTQLTRNPELNVKKEVENEKPLDIIRPVKEETIKQPVRNSFDITVDTIKEKKQKKQRLISSERNEFEIPQVISPIHGVKESELKQEPLQKPVRTRKVVNDPLGTVISPFFGNEYIEDEETNTKTHTSSMFDHIDQLGDEDVNEEIENISLDQMVRVEPKEDKEIIQFSLLGDDTSLKNLGEEDNQEEDEELPF